MSAIDAIAEKPWAITEDGLRTIVAIATRTNLSPEAVEAIRGEPLDNSEVATVRDGVASIPITGPIFRRANFFARISGATSTEVLATDLRAALNDPSVQAILLDIDSPGGEANGIGELAGMVRSIRGQKPIVAYISGAGCSAAYWIASAADQVIVSPTAVVGSIGALVSIPRREAGEREPLVIVSSQSPEKYHDPESVKGQSRIQALLDALATEFIADVAENRGITPADVSERYGQGGVFLGRAAVAAGLADRIGTYEGVMADLSALSSSGSSPSTRLRPTSTSSKGFKMAGNTASTTNSPTNPEATEVEQLRAQLKQAQDAQTRAEAAAAQAITYRIEAAAETFVAGLVDGPKAVLTPDQAKLTKAHFIQFARDDHAQPVAGAPNYRVDAFRAAFGDRKPHNLTREAGSGDENQRTRALSMDPAEDDRRAESQGDDEFDADLDDHINRHNGQRSR